MSNNIVDRMNQRVVEAVNYTVYDETVTHLLDVTKCSITMDTSDNNVIFNHQCYDKDAWCKHIREERRRNRNGERRDHRQSGDNHQLKDLRTGENMNMYVAFKPSCISSSKECR